ncbi:MAG: alkaline phosphatase family protein [Desulfobacteraceae bacterium]|nr:alkaline phosphatase family protein [Desulfobacteraceae bacterium]
MKHIFIIIATSTLLFSSAIAMTDSRPSVLYISIDGMRPDIIQNSKRYNKIKIPVLRSLMKKGTYAKQVIGVFPTLTYPSHASLITGTNPNTHGIINNKYFDPTGINKDAWMWFADHKVADLWKIAGNSGYTTANVGWPSTVGADIDFNIVEYWRTNTKLDQSIVDALGTKGLVKEVVAKTGIDRYPSADWDIKSDRARFAAGMYIMNNKLAPILQKEGKPFFMTQYFAAYDEYAHHYDWMSKNAFNILEEIDGMLGKMIRQMDRITDGNYVIAVVSDHGFISIDTIINLNTQFVKAGLICLDKEGNMKDWKVYGLDGHGSIYIKVKDAGDLKSYEKAKKILLNLAANKKNGIDKVYDRTQLKNIPGYKGADLVCSASSGYRFSTDLTGNLHSKPKTSPEGYLATHGFAPSNPDTHASAFLIGKGIPQGRNIGTINLIDIAPTLAKTMDLTLPAAEGKPFF